jgi:hypothetical protein
MKGPHMAATFLIALPRMTKVLRRWDGVYGTRGGARPCGVAIQPARRGRTPRPVARTGEGYLADRPKVRRAERHALRRRGGKAPPCPGGRERVVRTGSASSRSTHRRPQREGVPFRAARDGRVLQSDSRVQRPGLPPRMPSPAHARTFSGRANAKSHRRSASCVCSRSEASMVTPGTGHLGGEPLGRLGSSIRPTPSRARRA